MATYHYNLDEVSVIAMGIALGEFGKGESVTLEFKEDDWLVVQGHHGSVIRAKNPNHVADAKAILMPGSPFNDLLSAKVALDLTSGTAAGVFQVKDTNGTTVAASAISWCTKRAPVKCATEPGMVEWPFTVSGPIQWNVGSNRFLVPS